MDLCGPMRVKNINGKRYVLVIMDDYSRYTWVHFLRSKDEAPEVIIKFFKQIQVLLQAPVITTSTVRTPQKNEADVALCYPRNDREDIGNLGAKVDIGFFIDYCNTPKNINAAEYHMGCYFIIHSARYKRTTSKCVVCKTISLIF
ncbi:retrovirus-related pol polyprotein from transposon TNT 1-94 [Tanacetum coccineum]